MMKDNPTKKRSHEEEQMAATNNKQQKIATKTIFRLDYHRGVYVQVEIPVQSGTRK